MTDDDLSAMADEYRDAVAFIGALARQDYDACAAVFENVDPLVFTLRLAEVAITAISEPATTVAAFTAETLDGLREVR